MSRILTVGEFLNELSEALDKTPREIAKRGGYPFVNGPLPNARAIVTRHIVKNASEAGEALRQFVPSALEQLKVREREGKKILKIGELHVACCVFPAQMGFDLAVAVSFKEEGDLEVKE